MCFSSESIIHEVVIKVWHSFVIKNWQSKCNFLNFYVSHGSATTFLRDGEKYYIFVDNQLQFTTVKDL